MRRNPVRVLFIRANPVAPDPRVEKEARALLRAGYRVFVLGWDQTGLQPVQENIGGLQIERIRLVVRNARGLGNLPYLAAWQAKLISWLARHRRAFDVIHACDFDTVLPALIGKKLWGKKVVYDIFDLYADMLRLTPGYLVKIIRRAELKAVDMADAVILPDDARKLQISGSRPRRCAVIYNSPEEAPLSNETPGAGSRTCGLRLAYVGNLQVQRGLLILLEVLGRHPDWRLDLAGFGPDETCIREAAGSLPNVSWHGRISYLEALKLNQSADLLIATYDPALPNHKYSSPNKVFEAMMLGKPIIVAKGTNMDAIIEREGCGLVVKYGDSKALEDAMVELQNDVALRTRLGENGRRAYEKTYRWDLMQDRLLELYKEISS